MRGLVLTGVRVDIVTIFDQEVEFPLMAAAMVSVAMVLCCRKSFSKRPKGGTGVQERQGFWCLFILLMSVRAQSQNIRGAISLCIHGWKQDLFSTNLHQLRMTHWARFSTLCRCMYRTQIYIFQYCYNTWFDVSASIKVPKTKYRVGPLYSADKPLRKLSRVPARKRFEHDLSSREF